MGEFTGIQQAGECRGLGRRPEAGGDQVAVSVEGEGLNAVAPGDVIVNNTGRIDEPTR